MYIFIPQEREFNVEKLLFLCESVTWCHKQNHSFNFIIIIIILDYMSFSPVSSTNVLHSQYTDM